MIARHSIDLVLDTAQAEEVIGHFVNLKRRGVNLIGLCPFHDEKTPSFTVSPAKNIYKCFGCGKGGDAVRFIMDHEGYSFPEAIRYLAGMYHITLEETTPSPEEEALAMRTDSLYIVMEFSKNHFIHNLFKTQSGINIGLSYFKERGFRENTIREFELGFAPDESSDLTETAIQKKYKKEFLVELGLSNASGRDFFRNRVIFPIHNLSGKVIGFGGRALLKDKKVPKYINSPESEIYNKRKSLYGLYFAKAAIRKEDSCILVEGYTDVISLHQAGIQNVVASSGTSLTEDQIRLIKRYTRQVIVIYDGDQAGINAAIRGMEMILVENMFVRIVTLPETHDPDSFLREKGPAAFLEFLKTEAHDFILFKTQLLEKSANKDPVEKVRVLREIVSTLAKVPDPLARSTYVKECSTILNIEERILINETNKLIRNEIRQKKFREDLRAGQQTDMEVLSKTDREPAGQQRELFAGLNDEHLEKELIRLIMNHGDKILEEEDGMTVADFLIEQCQELIPYFEVDLYTQIFIDIIEKSKTGSLPDRKYFLNHENADIRSLAIDMMSNQYVYADWSSKGMELQTQKPPEENFSNESRQLSYWINYKKLDKIIAENIGQLKELDPESDDYLVVLKVHQKLLEERKTLAELLNNVIR